MLSISLWSSEAVQKRANIYNDIMWWSKRLVFSMTHPQRSIVIQIQRFDHREYFIEFGFQYCIWYIDYHTGHISYIANVGLQRCWRRGRQITMEIVVVHTWLDGQYTAIAPTHQVSAFVQIFFAASVTTLVLGGRWFGQTPIGFAIYLNENACDE